MEQVSAVLPGLPAARRVTVGSGGSRAVMWGGGVPSTVPGAAVEGAGGTRTAGGRPALLRHHHRHCHRTSRGPCSWGSLAGAGCQGVFSKGGSSCSLLGVICSPVTAPPWQPGWQRGRCSRGGQLELCGWLGMATHPMGAAKRGRSEWGTQCAPSWQGVPHGEAGLPHSLGSSPGTLFCGSRAGASCLGGCLRPWGHVMGLRWGLCWGAVLEGLCHGAVLREGL